MAIDAITCPTCGVEEPFDANGERPPPLHEVGKFKCDGCGTKYVFGKRVPRIVVEPNHDEKGLRWTRVRIQDPLTKADEFVFDVDPESALAFAKNILSLV
jgi:hypothetical protein